jgi:bacteriorhodopsin
MDWTFTNVVIQTACGLIGANIAAAASHEYRFGFWGHSIVGLVSGVCSGLFLQKVASTVVAGDGTLNAPLHFEILAAQVMTGAVAGGIAMMAVGWIISERNKAD